MYREPAVSSTPGKSKTVQAVPSHLQRLTAKPLGKQEETVSTEDCLINLLKTVADIKMLYALVI